MLASDFSEWSEERKETDTDFIKAPDFIGQLLAKKKELRGKKKMLGSSIPDSVRIEYDLAMSILHNLARYELMRLLSTFSDKSHLALRQDGWIVDTHGK